MSSVDDPIPRNCDASSLCAPACTWSEAGAVDQNSCRVAQDPGVCAQSEADDQRRECGDPPVRPVDRPAQSTGSVSYYSHRVCHAQPLPSSDDAAEFGYATPDVGRRIDRTVADVQVRLARGGCSDRSAGGPLVPHDSVHEDDLRAQAAGVAHAFTVQGPPQALAMLLGRKLVENRSWRIQPGWYALHVGSQRGSRWGERAGEICPDLPKEEQLTELFGSIIGLLQIGEQRTVEECNGYPWAFGPVCHVVVGAIRLGRPIRHRGNSGLWPLTPEVHKQICRQLHTSTVVRHDLSALGNRAPRCASGSAASCSPAPP